jgi:hypothetical protein
VERFETVLPHSGTVSFEGASQDRRDERTGLLVRQEIHLEVSRAQSGELEPALVIEGFVKARSEQEGADVAGTESAPGAPQPVSSTESPQGSPTGSPTVVMDEPEKVLERDCVILDHDLVLGGEPLILLFPSQVVPGTGLATVLTASEPPLEEEELAAHSEKLQAFLQGALEMEAAASRRASHVQRAEYRARELRSALESLESAPNRRAALVFLSSATGADLAGDLALEADDELLLQWSESILSISEEDLELLVAAEPQGRETPLGWMLERSACLLLSGRMSDAALPSELAGLLVRHAGEVSRSGGAIDDVVRASKGTEDFRARLIEENRIFLEDSSPGARVRAYDWLAARNLAPRGFDPLAPQEERTRVLAELEEAAAALSEAQAAEAAAQSTAQSNRTVPR